MLIEKQTGKLQLPPILNNGNLLILIIVDGMWSDWTAWSACPVSCSGGEYSRSRVCDSPAPQYGGQDCSGNSSETDNCNTEVCPPGQYDLAIIKQILLPNARHGCFFKKIFSLYCHIKEQSIIADDSNQITL